MELRVNDYVRTNDGVIAKVYKYEGMTYFFDRPLYKEYSYYLINYIRRTDIKNNIIKSSPNIIDLIEVGDYVNGERVINIIKKHKYLEVSDEEVVIDEKDIKSIVTKEQFESMEYRIGE